jgi:hypothetical protein
MVRETALEYQTHSNKSFSENGNDSSSLTTMLQTKLNLPLSRFGKPPEPDEIKFGKAVDHLSQLAIIIENQVMRQHGGQPPSARHIISFINQLCDTINIALVAIGRKNQGFRHPDEQTDSEEALVIALEEWDRFTEMAKNQCKRRVGITPSRESATPSSQFSESNVVGENLRSLFIPEFRPHPQGAVLKKWGPVRM